MTFAQVRLITAGQVADLATFVLVVSQQGIGGEIGPLGGVYRAAGFLGVAIVKLVALAAMLLLCEWHACLARPVASTRALVLLTAGVGALGAFTNVASLA